MRFKGCFKVRILRILNKLSANPKIKMNINYVKIDFDTFSFIYLS